MTAADYDGSYEYIGEEQSLGGYVALGPDGNYYVFSNQEYLPNQNFNVQQVPVVVCFLAGTMIATPSGEAAIETLKAGDLVLTADGSARLVRWLARQMISTVFADPLKVMPILVRAGALGDGLPKRDLYVSADHALLLDGMLAQAAALVNGTTIIRHTDMPTTFAYFHIELEDHTLILAEGVPAETYVDNVARRRFDNYAEYVALYGDAGPAIPEIDLPRVKSARQLAPATRARLVARAQALGLAPSVAA